MRPAPDGDVVDRLLRASGRRPAIPAERARRVEVAVAAHWQGEVRRRRRTRMAWAVAAVVAVGIGASALAMRLLPGRTALEIAQPAATVDRVLAGAWSAPHGSARAMRQGDTLTPGSAVATEETGGAALRLRAGHSVRLDTDTTVRVLSERAIALVGGGVYVDSRSPSGEPAGSVEVRTRWGVVRDLGTQFEVRILDAALRLRVREGAVELRDRQRVLRVAAGEEIRVAPDGTVDRRPARADDPGWAWAVDIAPVLDLQGRTVAEFVAWVAREQGRRVAYAQDEVARSAETTVLSGSIEGMSLDDALSSVLPTCRMQHRVRGDVLLVEAER